MNHLNYPIVIYPCDEGGFVAEVPALKGCLAQGETLVGTLEELTIVKQIWIETAQKHGESLPDVCREIERVKALTCIGSAEDQIISIFGCDYTLQLDPDTGGFSFEVLGVEYKVHETQKIENLQFYGIILDRCPDGFCDVCDTGFTTIKEAIQFADLYERLIQFTFCTEESKETAIKRLSYIVEDLAKMSMPRN